MKYNLYHSLSNSLLYHEWPAHFHHIYYLPGGCDQRTKRGREELPHFRGQGQKLGGPHAQRVAAKRSYPTFEVRGSSQECQAAMAQELPIGATQVRGQGWQPGGVTPHPRSGAAAGRS